MTDDDLRGIFRYALSRLDVDERGLSDDNDMADMNATAALCLAIKASAATADTLEQLLLHRLAILTERLLISPWVPDPGIAKEWLIARSELLQAEMPRA